MWRLTERIVRSGLVIAWRLATSPMSTSPPLEKATTEGVVRDPSVLGMTTGSPASRTETTELVVPRSMPTALGMGGSSGRCAELESPGRIEVESWCLQLRRRERAGPVRVGCPGAATRAAPPRRERVEPANLFTGWWDAALTAARRVPGHGGRAPDGRARRARPTSSTRRCRPGRSAPPSWRCAAMGRSWIPVRRDWRLNERHYGDLTGRNKAETAAALRRRPGEGVAPQLRRAAAADQPRTTRTTPTATSATPRCRRASCRSPSASKDVVARLLPYWDDVIAPDLRAGRTVLVGAHGNSLRALVKHLDDISDADIVELNIPTGEPLVYELGDDLRPVADRSRSRSATCAARRRSGPRPRPWLARQRADDRVPGGTMTATGPEEAVRCSDMRRAARAVADHRGGRRAPRGRLPDRPRGHRAGARAGHRGAAHRGAPHRGRRPAALRARPRAPTARHRSSSPSTSATTPSRTSSPRRPPAPTSPSPARTTLTNTISYFPGRRRRRRRRSSNDILEDCAAVVVADEGLSLHHRAARLRRAVRRHPPARGRASSTTTARSRSGTSSSCAPAT